MAYSKKLKNCLFQTYTVEIATDSTLIYSNTVPISSNGTLVNFRFIHHMLKLTTLKTHHT